MIYNLLRTKTTKKLWIIAFSLLCLYFYMAINMGNLQCLTNDVNDPTRDWDMTLQNLRQEVRNDDENGKKPVLAGDFDVKEFLEQIRKGDLKWNLEKLTDDQIEEIGRHLKKGRRKEKPRKLKHILYWNKAYGSDEYGFCCGQTPFIEAKCPINDCYATNNRSFMAHEDFDAILFHQRPMEHEDIPKKRSQHQRYIMWMMESAAYPFGFESSEWNGFFNWTMTFRQDSDFPSLYGHIVKVDGVDHPKEENELQKFIEKFGQENSDLRGSKNRPIAWFVSNCQSESQREDYVRELQKHIEVDIFGDCGDLKCERTNETACWELADHKYYFYLSFENSICLDYVTEKFFNAMDRKVVPIVIGGTDYHKSAGAPKHSHINAYKDYKNPADLARYLQSLIDDPEKYAEYFWWKEFYQSKAVPEVQRNPAFCEACRQLHENHETKIYSDLEEWWIHKSKCRKVRIADAN